MSEQKDRQNKATYMSAGKLLVGWCECDSDKYFVKKISSAKIKTEAIAKRKFISLSFLLYWPPYKSYNKVVL